MIAWASGHRVLVSNVLAALKQLPESRLRVAPIGTREELRALWELNRHVYGGGVLRFEGFLSWWRANPSGVFGLFMEGELIGGLSIWPLKRRFFHEALRGRREFSCKRYYRAQDAHRCPYWYVSGIVVREEFRGGDALPFMLLHVFRHALTAARSVMSFNVCAMAFSSEGTRLLARFGFKPANSGDAQSGRRPVYALKHIGPIHLKVMASRIGAIERRRQTIAAA